MAMFTPLQNPGRWRIECSVAEWRACKRKKKYGHAKVMLLAEKRSMGWYKCQYCKAYHLTSKRR